MEASVGQARRSAPALTRTSRRGSGFVARFAQNRLALAGTFVVVALAAIAIVGPAFVDDPTSQDVPMRFTQPNAAHPFGTDEVGRDLLARVVNGARISLASGLVSVAVGLGGGALIGIVAGYFGGRLDLVLIALIDLMLALPAILLAITIAARLGHGLPAAMLAVGLVGLPGYARLARASTLSVKRQVFVDAARATGAGNGWIAVHHVLPNILTPLVVQATIGVGNAVLLVSALGYLGLGAQPPTPEWGRLLSDAQRYVLDAPYIGVFPGLAISLTVLGFNLAGDGLRDALDPTSGRRT
jgi:ABC-type dipeptide/oligopeptide/nickel transport system permease subunit